MQKKFGSNAKYVLLNNKEKAIFTDVDFQRYWKTTEALKCINFNKDLKGIVHKKEEVFYGYQNFDKSIDAALVGVPYGAGSLKTGTKVGEFPDYLRKQSYNARVYYDIVKGGSTGLYDLDTQKLLFQGLKFADLGNLNVQSEKGIGKTIYELVEKFTSRKIPLIAIGGDHSISYYFIKKISSIQKRPVTVIIFDAHHDAKYSISQEKELNHANYVSSLLKHKNIEKIIQVGVRGIRSMSQWIENEKLIQISPSQLKKYEKAVSLCKEHKVYVSIDLDVLNTAEYPNVDYPVPGGLSVIQIQSCLDFLKKQKPHIVGADLVEGVPDDRAGYDSIAVKTLSLLLDCMQNKKRESR